MKIPGRILAAFSVGTVMMLACMSAAGTHETGPHGPEGTAPAVPVKAPEAACTCEAARLNPGWCELHDVGYVASIPIRSRVLYETLDAHGHTLDLDAFRCESCREAIRIDGFCERDRIGFIENQAYFSRLTYELARGEKRPSETIVCPTCRKNAGSNGWCETHGVGMIGAIQAKDRQGYDKAAAALEILIAANEMAATCEGCAVAMITDSLCARHRISYQGGKPVVATP